MGFILSPFISPFVFGFLVARARYDARLALPMISVDTRTQLALGVWNRLYLRRNRAVYDRVLRRGDVSSRRNIVT